jgi:MinD superfamily P-loop ATPase
VKKARQAAGTRGKGRTGKPIVTALLGAAAGNSVLRLRVDAADLLLLLHPEVEERNRFALRRA